MISFGQIQSFYKPLIKEEYASTWIYATREYLQLMILNRLSTTGWLSAATLIGTMPLRLSRGLNRFSEKLHFDFQGLDSETFASLIHDISSFLKQEGITYNIKECNNENNNTFQITFDITDLWPSSDIPVELKETSFPIIIEAGTVNHSYNTQIVYADNFDLSFSFNMPYNDVTLSMKLARLLESFEGRDLYDILFLLKFTKPNYEFLKRRCGITSPAMLKFSLENTFEENTLYSKLNDIRPLIFNKNNHVQISELFEFIFLTE